MEREKAISSYPPDVPGARCLPERLLGVAAAEPSARASANAQLTQQIVQIHQQSRGTYGALRVQAELRARDALRAQPGGAAHAPGGSDGLPSPAAGARAHDPARSGGDPRTGSGRAELHGVWSDRLWVADMTYLPTEQEGFLYLAVILDVFSRRVVGWSMQDQLRTELVLAALEMAVSKRRPEAGLIHHSDHGSQIYLGALWRAVCGGRHSLVDGDRGGLLRQRPHGELFRHPGV